MRMQVLLFNAVSIAGLLAAFEIGLRVTDPRADLPPNGKVDGVRYTWGHEDRRNSWGFREAEVGPKRGYRVMVLGDSLTWGAGLAPEQRFTELAAAELGVEVLNFGIPGIATTGELEVLEEFGERTNPDRVVVGFCWNDPQPREQNWSVERERFYRIYGEWIRAATRSLEAVGLVQIARRVERAIEKAGAFPHWTEALARVYEPDAPDWIAFTRALDGIKAWSDARSLSPPVFLELAQAVSRDGPPDYDAPSGEKEARLATMYDRASAAARERGFVVAQMRRALANGEAGEQLTVNVADGHPSASLHVLYARALVEAIEAGRVEPEPPPSVP